MPSRPPDPPDPPFDRTGPSDRWPTEEEIRRSREADAKPERRRYDGIMENFPRQVMALQDHVRRLEHELREAHKFSASLQGDVERMRVQMEAAHAHREKMIDTLMVTRGLMLSGLDEAKSTFRRLMGVHIVIDGLLLASLLGTILVLVLRSQPAAA